MASTRSVQSLAPHCSRERPVRERLAIVLAPLRVVGSRLYLFSSRRGPMSRAPVPQEILRHRRQAVS
jgi:hypothetical protein